jgi:hypothetical protein
MAWNGRLLTGTTQYNQPRYPHAGEFMHGIEFQFPGGTKSDLLS